MSEAARLAAYHVNKTGWPDGPWMQEPDRVQWRTVAGLPGLVVRQPVAGALCGYAGVPPGHPMHGLDCSADDFPRFGHGIDYSAPCQVDGPVCHVPEPGEPDDVWWLGFHCAHGWDYAPADSLASLREAIADVVDGDEAVAASLQRLLDRHPRRPPTPAEVLTYRTIAAVRARVECLAADLARFGR